MRGAAVLFLPGFMQHAETWSEVAGPVGERYPSVVAALSSWTFGERLRELREVSVPGDVLVGYSLGGRTALHAALAEPERYGGIVVLGASGGIDDPAARAERVRADEDLAAWMETSSIEDVVARWERNPVFATQPAALVDLQRPGRLRHDPRALAQLLRTGGQGALGPIWSRLAELRTPLLALAGELDRPYVAAARRIAAIAPNAVARSIPGAGHAAHLEAPVATAAALTEFLDQHFGDRLLRHLDA